MVWLSDKLPKEVNRYDNNNNINNINRNKATCTLLKSGSNASACFDYCHST